MKGLRQLPHTLKLRRPDFLFLKRRRHRSGLILAFENFKGFLDPSDFFLSTRRIGLRGHIYRIQQGTSRRRRRSSACWEILEHRTHEWSFTPKWLKTSSIHTATRHAWTQTPPRNIAQKAVFSLTYLPASFIRLWPSCHSDLGDRDKADRRTNC